MPPTKTWKAAERKVAAYFGTLRQRLSGSSGRADETAADTKHPVLFIEVKYRAEHAVRTLMDSTRKLAAKEGKLPIIALVSKGKPGFLAVIHSDDLRQAAIHILSSTPGTIDDCEEQ